MQRRCFVALARVSEFEQMPASGVPSVKVVALEGNAHRALAGAPVLAIGATAVERCIGDRSPAASRLAEGGAFVDGARPNISLNADACWRPLRGRAVAGQFRR